MEFKYIRNRIGEYSKRSLLECALRILKEAEKHNDNLHPVWQILILIKWTFLYSNQKYPAKIATDEIVTRLLGYIGELQDQHPFFLGSKSFKINKLLSLLAYQQFYFQHTIWKDTFSRQIQLFTKLKSRYAIEDTFMEYTNISIEDFILCSFLLWAYTNPDQHNGGFEYDGIIHQNFQELANKILPDPIVNSYIDLLTVDENLANLIATEDKRIMNEEFQLFEISIFTQHPIFKFNNQLFVFHRKILNYTINYFIYDFLKSKDNERFSEEFGHRFEKYVELGLMEVNFTYKTENQLKKELPYASKVVDFIVDDHILIECKAIELKPYPNVFPDDDVIYNWLKSSVVKAYSQQMLSVANSMKSSVEKFGIIITYKETYFGNGLDAWESFLQKPTEAYALGNNLNLSELPPSNLFFIDIVSWDKIILAIKEGKATLREILEKARENDKTPTSKKFLFSMHLKEYDLGAFNLSYINEGYTEAFKDLI